MRVTEKMDGRSDSYKMKYLNFLYKAVSMALLAILLAYFGLLILDGFG